METASIKCPECGHEQQIEIPDGKCLAFYKCEGCEKTIAQKSDSCCVICSYSDKKCPCNR